ncbi:uncharacterized protein LOC134256020 [Saccostrea cucullata]|uniref:uncharacterized protein LOC134256020 n=1 Tax=Saccostrea cuccullata TaxID=36930 RepID=UPI002ED49A3C
MCFFFNIRQFSTTKRDADEVKKKYFNLKQRAKEKIDLIKRSVRQTGGGPAPPPLTSAEEALANSLDGRPVVEGIDGGIDTDVIEESSPAPCSSLSDAPTCSATPQVYEKNIMKKTRPGTCSEIDKLLAENLKMDKQRLELEVLKLRKETEKLSEEIAYFNVKKLYYQLKLQTEFQIPIAEP